MDKREFCNTAMKCVSRWAANLGFETSPMKDHELADTIYHEVYKPSEPGATQFRCSYCNSIIIPVDGVYRCDYCEDPASDN